jgi:hypothetical protein
MVTIYRRRKSDEETEALPMLLTGALKHKNKNR